MVGPAEGLTNAAPCDLEEPFGAAPCDLKDPLAAAKCARMCGGKDARDGLNTTPSRVSMNIPPPFFSEPRGSLGAMLTGSREITRESLFSMLTPKRRSPSWSFQLVFMEDLCAAGAVDRLAEGNVGWLVEGRVGWRPEKKEDWFDTW